MKFTSVLIFLCLLGCSEIMDIEEPSIETNQAALVTSDDTSVNSTEVMMPSAKEIPDYYRDPMVKNVNHYAKWIAQDLFGNLDYPSNQDVFVVSDFALLDSNLNETNHFGRQLTQALMHEVNRTGFSVIDAKAMGFIRVTEKGDVFFHSNDYTELSQKIPATNIIAGTLTRHQGGYLINARIISMESMAMVSSAQAFVPYDVVEAVLLEEKVNLASEKNEQAKQAEEKPVPVAIGIPLTSYKKSINK